MNIQNKPIAFLQDSEIIELLGVCAELFGTQLRDYGLQAFIYLLKQKYNLTTDKKILESCTNFAALQAQGKRFSPALLSHILINSDRDKQQEYKSYETTPEQKAFYKQEFLKAVYADFDDYCNKIPPSRIYVWRFVCKKLVQSGVIKQSEYDVTHDEDLTQQFSSRSAFKSLCLKAFNDLAMQGKEITTFIK